MSAPAALSKRYPCPIRERIDELYINLDTVKELVPDRGTRGLAHVRAMPDDEFQLNVALGPTTDAEDWIRLPQAGPRAGHAFVACWFDQEHRRLQSEGMRVYCSRSRQREVFALPAEPVGFSDRGPVRL
jgi:hypothetical protein